MLHVWPFKCTFIDNTSTTMNRHTRFASNEDDGSTADDDSGINESAASFDAQSEREEM
jgi:hypothetical protein